jgi:hypothetical protein
MVDQTTTKPMGLIKDLKIYVHNIPYITTFIVLQNSVVDSSYSMLLGRPWLGDAKVAHDWESNTITIQGNGIIRTIVVSKHLGNKVKDQKCYCVMTIIMVSQMKKKISSLLQSQSYFQ